MASENQMIVVVYDISNDRRRTRLHKKLKNYGTPVQYSVFECLLTSEEIAQMKAEVRRILKPRLDHVRYYQLCTACRRRIEVTGRHEITTEPKAIVV
jgi:CRISPR-associated protein Cas2